MPEPFSHFVFVDFENVPSIDLAPIEGKPVHVTLLIGKNQKRLELELVRQIHQHATQVSLIEVGASGRNALDLVLAAHLGQTLRSHPEATFIIISRDHDFDPLVAHFNANGRHISRKPNFSAQSIFPAAKPPSAGPRSRSTPAKAPAHEAKTHTASATAAHPRQAKIDALIARLRRGSNRPKSRDSLLHHINTVFGQKLTRPEQEEIFNELLALGLFTIPDGRKIAYSP